MYASRRSGDLGFQHLYTEQGIVHVVKLMQSLWTPSESCQLTRITLSWWHTNPGVGFDLLSSPCCPVVHLEGAWLTCTQDFLASIDARLRFSFRSHLLTFRENDRHIMDTILEQIPYGRHRIRLINFCPFYLQVSCTSELTNAAGTALLPKFWMGELSSRQSAPTH